MARPKIVHQSHAQANAAAWELERQIFQARAYVAALDALPPRTDLFMVAAQDEPWFLHQDSAGGGSLQSLRQDFLTARVFMFHLDALKARDRWNGRQPGKLVQVLSYAVARDRARTTQVQLMTQAHNQLQDML